MPYFEYRQNNSGGSFQIDKDITTYMVIEADDAEDADRRAESIGLYFDGAGDCPCCGDRWDSSSGDEGSETPELYGRPVYEYKDPCNWTGKKPYAYVYHKDGTKESFSYGK